MPNWLTDAECVLIEACPELLNHHVRCPQGGCGAHGSLWNIITHLNDSHRWPRVKDDSPYRLNIADWLEEWSVREGVDLTFTNPSEENDSE